jgi:hypothetical protein
MNISSTPFEYTYHTSKKAGNSTHGRYIFHEVDVYNVINIDGIELQAIYQCGVSYDYNDYNYPRPILELSADGGTSEVLATIGRISEKDFDEDDKEYILEVLAEVEGLFPVIDSVEKLQAVYNALNDNKPILSEFLDPDEYTDNLDDYLEDEASGLLTLKS